MFRVTGIINKEQESITYDWDNGKGSVQGDPMVMFLMRNALLREAPVGPVGQYMDRSLDEPLSALFMILECFDEIISCEGDVPKAGEIAEGAFC